MSVIGRINAFQSMGTLDGPGVRCVVFMQGCPLRCGYCHNPETWDMNGGTEVTPEEIFAKITRCRPYFGSKGGVTVSGGEPLLQARFVKELFMLCKNANINTCIDTAGSVWNADVEALIDYTDLFLLDCKMTNEHDYTAYIHGDFTKPEAFMRAIAAKGKRSWVRQVAVPAINDCEQNIKKLSLFTKINPMNERVELLPFHKMCHTKYEELGIEFPFGSYNEPTNEQMARLNALLDEYMREL